MKIKVCEQLLRREAESAPALVLAICTCGEDGASVAKAFSCGKKPLQLAARARKRNKGV